MCYNGLLAVFIRGGLNASVSTYRFIGDRVCLLPANAKHRFTTSFSRRRRWSDGKRGFECKPLPVLLLPSPDFIFWLILTCFSRRSRHCAKTRFLGQDVRFSQGQFTAIHSQLLLINTWNRSEDETLPSIDSSASAKTRQEARRDRRIDGYPSHHAPGRQRKLEYYPGKPDSWRRREWKDFDSLPLATSPCYSSFCGVFRSNSAMQAAHPTVAALPHRSARDTTLHVLYVVSLVPQPLPALRITRSLLQRWARPG